MSVIYARLINQYKFKYKTVFSAIFNKQDEDGLMLGETESGKIYIISHNLTESDINDVDVVFPLEEQIQKQEIKSGGWNFDKTISMTKIFLKTTEIQGSSDIKLPLRSSTNLKIENVDKCFFNWSRY